MVSLGFRRSKPKASISRLDSISSLTSSFEKNSSDQSLRMSISKNRQPFDSLRKKGIVKDEMSETDLREVRSLCRLYYKYHDLIPMIITIYAQFPLQGMRIVCRSKKEQDLFDRQFFGGKEDGGLDYENYLVDLGKEYFKIGEANSFGIFDYESKKWISEEILNPDDIFVEDSVFAGEEEVSISLSEQIKDVAHNPSSAQFEYLRQVYPDLVNAAEKNQNVRLNEDFIFRMVERADPWDLRGTPIMTRAFASLLKEETLNAAHDAVADRMYSPMVLARLGIPASEMGQDQPPWIPSQEQLESFTEQMDKALAADFRLLVHHFGLDIKSVFGRESMPNLDNDFSRVEAKILRSFGIGAGLLDGSNQGAYASSAINRDFVSQLMASYQRNVRSLFKKRAKIFSEERHIYELEDDKDGKKAVVYDVLYSKDESGVIHQEKIPKPFVPELEFASDPLKDSAFEVNLLSQLKSIGIPISDQTIMEATGKKVDLDTELSRIEDESVHKKISEISMGKKLEAELQDMGIDTSEEGMLDEQQLQDRMSPDEEATGPTAIEQQTDTYHPSEEA